MNLPVYSVYICRQYICVILFEKIIIKIKRDKHKGIILIVLYALKCIFYICVCVCIIDRYLAGIIEIKISHCRDILTYMQEIVRLITYRMNN